MSNYLLFFCDLGFTGSSETFCQFSLFGLLSRRSGFRCKILHLVVLLNFGLGNWVCGFLNSKIGSGKLKFGNACVSSVRVSVKTDEEL